MLTHFRFAFVQKDVDEIVNTVKMIAGSFGGVNLEDISAPRCIEIERRLREECDIPVFHDDQHGTAVVVLASVLNALKVVGKDITEIKSRCKRCRLGRYGDNKTACFKRFEKCNYVRQVRLTLQRKP